MLVALKPFDKAGVSVRKGEVVPPLTFEADEVAIMLGAGYLMETEKPEPKAPGKQARKPK